MRKELQRIKDTLYGTCYYNQTKEEVKEDMGILLTIINTTKNKNIKCECDSYYDCLSLILDEKDNS